MTDAPLQYGDHVEHADEPGVDGTVRQGPPSDGTDKRVYVEFNSGVCGWYSPDELVRVGGNGEAK